MKNHAIHPISPLVATGAVPCRIGPSSCDFLRPGLMSSRCHLLGALSLVASFSAFYPLRRRGDTQCVVCYNAAVDMAQIARTDEAAPVAHPCMSEIRDPWNTSTCLLWAPGFPESARPITSRLNVRQKPTQFWTAEPRSGEPGTCSATREYVPIPTCTRSATPFVPGETEWRSPTVRASANTSGKRHKNMESTARFGSAIRSRLRHGRRGMPRGRLTRQALKGRPSGSPATSFACAAAIMTTPRVICQDGLVWTVTRAASYTRRAGPRISITKASGLS